MTSSEPTDRVVRSSFSFEVDAPHGTSVGDVIRIWNSNRRKLNRSEIIFDVTHFERIDASGARIIARVQGISRELDYDDMSTLVITLIREVAPNVRYFTVNHRERKLPA